jgi:hypothetical protein
MWDLGIRRCFYVALNNGEHGGGEVFIRDCKHSVGRPEGEEPTVTGTIQGQCRLSTRATAEVLAGRRHAHDYSVFVAHC